VIRYALHCDSGHGFESWFRSSDDYDKQRKRGLVNCPECGSAEIEKQIMKPSLARGSARKAREEVTATPVVADEKSPVAVISPQEQFLRTKLKELREHITKSADYVGEKFPELARQMHYDEIDQRSIYGEAKPDEVKELIEEGVAVQPLPILPEDRN
jgi:hypothetical protein